MIWLLACAPALEAPLLDAYPNLDLMSEGRLALPELPYAETPFDTERLATRAGFSPVQTTVFRLDAEPASLEGVEVWDLSTGERLDALVELDAYPQSDEAPSLLVRPLQVYEPGHLIGVAIRGTTGLESPDWWAWAMDGGELTGRDAQGLRELNGAFEALGVRDVVWGTSFLVGDGTVALRAMLREQAAPSGVVIDEVETEGLPQGVAMLIEGHFETDTWLVDDVQFALDANGEPLHQGRYDADFLIMVPSSVADSGQPTDELWVFGHGIFSQPGDYLDDEDDGNGVIRAANLANAVVVGGYWRGLCRPDLSSAVAAGNDFGRIPEVTDKLAQGVADVHALIDLAAGGALFGQPETQDLWTGEALGYYGISLGGIEGAVLMATQDTIAHGVLHVGGASWSTMLERSSNWTTFEALVVDDFASAWERQLLYAVSQLFWDPADPANYASALRDRSVLWQISVGDEQVPNLTSELVARRAEAVQVGPVVYEVAALEQVSAPAEGPAFVLFDPEKPLPDESNRPGEVTYAHSTPRAWPGTRQQIERFLRPSDPGVVAHFCGDTPCSASNPGTE